MPDVFVPQDTTGVTSYLTEVLSKGLTIQFTFHYTDNNRDKLKKYEDEESLLNYLRRQGLVEQFIRYADSKGVKRRNILIQKSYKLLEKSIYGNTSIICMEKKPIFNISTKRSDCEEGRRVA